MQVIFERKEAVTSRVSFDMLSDSAGSCLLHPSADTLSAQTDC